MRARVRPLPLEILSSILEFADGDLSTFASMCLTNKQFNSWAQFEALKCWPRLRQDLRDRGIRICNACYKILPPKRWVELAPRSWTWETDCITCTIRGLSATGPSFEQIRRRQRSNPAYRPCLCCTYDYGTKKSVDVQQKLKSNGVFCERCTVRMKPELGDLTLRVLAVQCITMYLAKLING
jgi:hypothetical protein